ncbi:MAG: methionyl-tRNA formyltransferase [Clostridia bacterium]|nr:methionyl-tRNA formyltransferase [Clostridia bacterium]
MRVVFMGTPDFAVPCLEKLVECGHDVVGVFTQPDKPVGRKRIITPPEVKVCALKHGIDVYQPEKMRDGTALEIIKGLNPELIVVVAYGKILPKEILDFPKYGCINIHGSLLPKLRGAAPIQWSVINGDEYAGVTSMMMNEGLDTGDMILRREVKIDFNETSGQLYDRLSFVGADVLEETLLQLENGTMVCTPQNDKESTYAPLLSKELSEINWNDTALAVYNKIRGLNPWPVAVTYIDGVKFKIFESEYIENVKGTAGEIADSNKKLVVACGDGNGISIKTLQPDGKKQMDIVAYLSGNKLEKGKIIG